MRGGGGMDCGVPLRNEMMGFFTIAIHSFFPYFFPPYLPSFLPPFPPFHLLLSPCFLLLSSLLSYLSANVDRERGISFHGQRRWFVRDGIARILDGRGSTQRFPHRNVSLSQFPKTKNTAGEEFHWFKYLSLGIERLFAWCVLLLLRVFETIDTFHSLSSRISDYFKLVLIKNYKLLLNQARTKSWIRIWLKLLSTTNGFIAMIQILINS